MMVICLWARFKSSKCFSQSCFLFLFFLVSLSYPLAGDPWAESIPSSLVTKSVDYSSSWSVGFVSNRPFLWSLTHSITNWTLKTFISLLTLSLSFSLKVSPSSFCKYGSFVKICALYDFLVASGLHLMPRSFRFERLAFICSTCVQSLIQLWVRSRNVILSLFSRFRICLMKLLWRSNFYRLTQLSRLSMSSISLKDKIRVLRLTRFWRPVIFFILLLNMLI